MGRGAVMVWILVASTSIWLVFKNLTPDEPLNVAETSLVVFISSIIVLGVRWFLLRSRKERKGETGGH